MGIFIGLVFMVVAALSCPPLGFCMLAGLGAGLVLQGLAKSPGCEARQVEPVRPEVRDDPIAALFE